MPIGDSPGQTGRQKVPCFRQVEEPLQAQLPAVDQGKDQAKSLFRILPREVFHGDLLNFPHILHRDHLLVGQLLVDDTVFIQQIKNLGPSPPKTRHAKRVRRRSDVLIRERFCLARAFNSAWSQGRITKAPVRSSFEQDPGLTFAMLAPPFAPPFHHRKQADQDP